MSPGIAFARQFAMQKFADAFVRNPDGSWFCRAPAEFIPPTGDRVTVTPGVTYRVGKLAHGWDVARWLNEWTQHGRAPIGVSFPAQVP